MGSGGSNMRTTSEMDCSGAAIMLPSSLPPHEPGGAGGAGGGGATRAAWKPQGRGNAGMRPWWGGDHQDVRM